MPVVLEVPYLHLYAHRTCLYRNSHPKLFQKRPGAAATPHHPQGTVLAAITQVFSSSLLCFQNGKTKNSRNGRKLQEMVQTVWKIPEHGYIPTQAKDNRHLWPWYWIKTLIMKALTDSYGKTDFCKSNKN